VPLGMVESFVGLQAEACATEGGRYTGPLPGKRKSAPFAETAKDAAPKTVSTSKSGPFTWPKVLRRLVIRTNKVFAANADGERVVCTEPEKGYIVSTSGITSSLLAQIAESSSTANQFTSDLNQLAQDLQSGNLSAAQQDYVTLSEDALNGTGSSTADTSASGITPSLLSSIASSSSDASSFTSELNQLGSDLQNGDLTSAQQDMLALDSTALNSAPAASSDGSSSDSGTASAASPSPNNSATLIHAILQAMEVGDNATVSSALSQLAAISPSSAGASALQQASESFGASSSNSPSSTAISQLLQSLGTSGSGSSGSILDVLT